MAGLLSDEELTTATDPDAPEEKPLWIEWMMNKPIPIRFLSSDNLFGSESAAAVH